MCVKFESNDEELQKMVLNKDGNYQHDNIIQRIFNNTFILKSFIDIYFSNI